MDTKDANAHPLDRIDEAIIDILRHDGRITFEKLSSLVHLTPRPCLERVRKLERRGVIRGSTTACACAAVTWSTTGCSAKAG